MRRHSLHSVIVSIVLVLVVAGFITIAFRES